MNNNDSYKNIFSSAMNILFRSVCNEMSAIQKSAESGLQGKIWFVH